MHRFRRFAVEFKISSAATPSTAHEISIYGGHPLKHAQGSNRHAQDTKSVVSGSSRCSSQIPSANSSASHAYISTSKLDMLFKNASKLCEQSIRPDVKNKAFVPTSKATTVNSVKIKKSNNLEAQQCVLSLSQVTKITTFTLF